MKRGIFECSQFNPNLSGDLRDLFYRKFAYTTLDLNSNTHVPSKPKFDVQALAKLYILETRYCFSQRSSCFLIVERYSAERVRVGVAHNIVVQTSVIVGIGRTYMVHYKA